jgi:hypothetical protein
MLRPASDILNAAFLIVDDGEFIGRSAEFLDLSLKLANAADSVEDWLFLPRAFV